MIAAVVSALSLGTPLAARASRLLDAMPDVGAGGPPAGLSAADAPFAGAASVDVPTLAHGGRGPAAHISRGPVAHIADLAYNGGQVLHANRVEAIFWEPAGSGLSFPPGYETVIEQFLRDVAADSHLPTNTYSLSGQYADSGGPAVYDATYGGAVVDTDALPNNSCVEPPINGPGWGVCIDDNQIQNEIEQVISSQNLNTGPNDIYMLITPPGLGSCETTGPTDCALGGKTAGSYCGYHSVTDNSQYLYAVIPYNAEPGHCQSNNPRPSNNPADPTMSTISHEQLETITDPYGDAWVNANGNEAADICITDYGAALGGSGANAYNEVINGDHYYLQELWSNWSHACEPRAEPDTLSFSVTGTPVAGQKIALAAHAVAAHGQISSYEWSFGAHMTGHGASPSPVLSRPGRYLVSVRTTDSAGLWAFAQRTVNVHTAASSRRRRGSGGAQARAALRLGRR